MRVCLKRRRNLVVRLTPVLLPPGYIRVTDDGAPRADDAGDLRDTDHLHIATDGDELRITDGGKFLTTDS